MARNIVDAAEDEAADFAGLIEGLSRKVGTGVRVKTAAHLVATMHNRMPLTRSLKSLGRRERATLFTLGERELVPGDGVAQPGLLKFHFGIWPYGRLFLGPAGMEEELGYRVMAHLHVAESEVREIGEHLTALELAESGDDAEVEAFFEEQTADELAELVRRVQQDLDRIDPVLLYVEDRTFTNVPGHNNLLGKSGQIRQGSLLSDPNRPPPSQWAAEEKTLLFCLFLLRSAGWRSEEFSGAQLTTYFVRERLVARIASYSEELQGSDGALGAPADSLRALAQQVASLRSALRATHVCYRWVSGLNFYKEERWWPRSKLALDLAQFPEAVAKRIDAAYGIKAGQFRTLDAFLGEATRAAMAAPAPTRPGAHSGAESLLSWIVEAGTSELASDYGMSRGLRDLAAFQGALIRDEVEAICNWPASHYYCGVVPSESVLALTRSNRSDLTKVLVAIANRMQFNSWHYMPGHFSGERIPAGRHYYLPPKMSDTAEWSNFHHAGHVLAQVRYSIRAPAPLRVQDRLFYGFLDFRVMRSEGKPYTRSDLFRARNYAGYLRSVVQSASDEIARTGISSRVNAFTKPWYEQAYAVAMEPRAVERPPAAVTQ